MQRRLPPLNSLRAFESAARLLSFTKAADELAVTQSAVSHQVKTLEDWAGLPLFRRDGRAVALTEAAAKFLPAVTQALDQLALAGRKLQAVDPGQGWLTVAVMPSFAGKWLVPRLAAFRAMHPNIDVWLASFEAQTGALGPDVDIAIRYGREDWAGLTRIKILGEELFPVCAPAMAAQLKDPTDLARVTLLHDELREDWVMWLRTAGVPTVDSTRGPGFDDSGLLIQAAIEGLGVALGRSVLVKGDLDAGRLVRPFATSLKSESAYYLVYPPELENAPKIKAFRDWLLATAEQSAA
ncbi:MAG: transcriptional regulator GcvA [Alphaproteobacteria bacterium]|nr:transcriptional regulator GcvA [Alphaproteobacteria bacterium]